ncbi:uncharacterized protein DUF202 [Micromonospora sp. M71_S20]|uniref:DUF202 domain-containing protein n=1 Tax=Micromonospora sp. M71_S20 TaxID=592872 RepID=UPI000F1FB507|nr:DUF202 domain-containing protein [Micromonospora sp. M71_S20]RLK25867.1 uncharacterized protein DUF202 [Micromonospora sp. M71_S20]
MTPPPLDGDPGLQLERTMLAWRRTAAAFLVAGAVGARLLTPLLGGWAYPAVAAPALCAGALALARCVPSRRTTGRRPATTARGKPMPPGPTVVTPGAGWMAGVAALTCLLGLAAAATVLTATTPPSTP